MKRLQLKICTLELVQSGLYLLLERAAKSFKTLKYKGRYNRARQHGPPVPGFGARRPIFADFGLAGTTDMAAHLH